jgi:hypothetical protein
MVANRSGRFPETCCASVTRSPRQAEKYEDGAVDAAHVAGRKRTEAVTETSFSNRRYFGRPSIAK